MRLVLPALAAGLSFQACPAAPQQAPPESAAAAEPSEASAAEAAIRKQDDAPRILIIPAGPSCPGKMVFEEMEGPTRLEEAPPLPAEWVSCIAEQTRGATGKSIDAMVSDALEKCGKDVPGVGEAVGAGLYEGYYCATVRARDVYYYVEIGETRVLEWEGWHVWSCNEPE